MGTAHPHLSQAEIRTEIYNAEYLAIQQIIDFLHDHISHLELNYLSVSSPNELQTITYYCSHNAALKFKHELQKQQHEAHRKYISDTIEQANLIGRGAI